MQIILNQSPYLGVIFAYQNGYEVCI